MRPKLHRALLRRLFLRVLGLFAIGFAFWFVGQNQSLVDPGISQNLLLGFGLIFLFGPAIWPRMQRLRMRLSVSRPLT